MPAEDFGFERILVAGYKHIIVDTSALFYNFRFGMSGKQQADFNYAVRNPEIKTRLGINRRTLSRSIDFNIIFSILLGEEPAFRVLRCVTNGEYQRAETFYARRVDVPLLRERLAARYNESVERLQEVLKAKAKPLCRNAARELKKLESDYGNLSEVLSPTDKPLSPVDRRILAAFFHYIKRGEDSALLTRDTRIIKAGSALVRKLEPKGRCDFFTMLETDRLKRAKVKNRRITLED